MSVSLSICPIRPPHAARVCCCGQEISIDSSGHRAPQHGRRSTAHSSQRGMRRLNAGSATLSADAGSCTLTCFLLSVLLHYAAIICWIKIIGDVSVTDFLMLWMMWLLIILGIYYTDGLMFYLCHLFLYFRNSEQTVRFESLEEWCNFNVSWLDSSPRFLFWGNGEIASNLAKKFDDALIWRVVVTKQLSVWKQQRKIFFQKRDNRATFWEKYANLHLPIFEEPWRTRWGYWANYCLL